MTRYLLRRLLTSAFVLLVASALCYGLIALAPGNVAINVAQQVAGSAATTAQVEEVERELGLDRPLPLRYLAWIGNALKGDLGRSLEHDHPVTAEIRRRLPVTLHLIVGAGALALLSGLALGVWGALSDGGWADRLLRPVAMLGVSTPSFFLGALLILLFGVQLRLLPTFGYGGPSSWILPCVTLALMPAMVLSRVLRVTVAEAMSRPYAVTGVAKGMTRAEVVLREALPNVATTCLTAFGNLFALMFVGAIVAERVFAWPGLGGYFLGAIEFRDFPVIQAVLVLFIAGFIAVNLAVDLLCGFIDPRIRESLIEVRP